MKTIKLAQPGYDVKTASDANLIFNSNWPNLKIYKQGSYTITNFTQDQLITTHDLGFTPFFWWFSNENIEGWQGTSITRSPQPRSEFHGDLGGNGTLNINSSQLIFKPVQSPAGSLTVYWYIFAIPIDQDYQAPSIKLGTQSSLGSGSKVFKIAKPGADIRSHNLEDYVVHSDARSPMLHSVNVKKLGSEDNNSLGIPQVTVYHNLGYRPMFFGFFLQSDKTYIMAFGTSIIPNAVGFVSDEQKVRYIYPSLDTISIVILKDPFDIDNVIPITI